VGLIDTLSAGFDRTAKRLWLILIPILLDLSVWLGPRLSLNRLSQEALALLPDATELGAQYAQAVDLSRAWLQEAGKTVNLLTLLSMRVLGLPGLSGSLVLPAPPFTLLRPVELSSASAAAGVTTGLLLLSLLVSCVVLSFIAADARDGQLSPRYSLRVAWRAWLRMTAILTIAAALGFGLLVGVGVIAGLVSLISSGLASLVLNVVAWTVLSLSVYGALLFFFASRALLLDDEDIVRSLWSAFNVLHRNFFSAVGFVLIVNLLHAGLLYIWRLLAASTFGMVAGIVGNAYVNTGLVMASFIFYRDRFAAWQEALQADKVKS